jgi:hypothetical protein
MWTACEAELHNGIPATKPVELYIAWRRANDNPARRSILGTCLEYTSALRTQDVSGIDLG